MQGNVHSRGFRFGSQHSGGDLIIDAIYGPFSRRTEGSWHEAARMINRQRLRLCVGYTQRRKQRYGRGE
jgi:hypothetical protein